jgi:hypothetical protein
MTKYNKRRKTRKTCKGRVKDLLVCTVLGNCYLFEMLLKYEFMLHHYHLYPKLHLIINQMPLYQQKRQICHQILLLLPEQTKELVTAG